jgi:hypothetical protein
MRTTRRKFFGQVAAGALMASQFPRMAAPLLPGRVPDEVDDLVRWIVAVPHADANGQLIDRVKKGLKPEPLLAALLLAGVQEVEPRPLGFKFHCVMELWAVHGVMEKLPAAQRILPLVYGLDSFKQSQEAQLRAGAWHLPAVDEKALPDIAKAKGELAVAMDAWDLAKADAAATALARAGKRDELVATIAPRAARSFDNVGHGPIAAANGFRTLDVIGWNHSETVVRSVVNGLLRLDRKAGAPPDEPVSSEPAIWPQLAQRASELMARSPGLLAVHATTGVNALEWLARASPTPADARLCRAQAEAWMPLWRDAFARRGSVRASDFSLLMKEEPGTAQREPVAALDDLGHDRWKTALALVGGLRDEKARAAFVSRARELLVAKGGEAHDWKFFVALEETLAICGAELAAPILACGVHYLRDGAEGDVGPVAEARAALAV